jgi:uncharacterized membrane protein
MNIKLNWIALCCLFFASCDENSNMYKKQPQSNTPAAKSIEPVLFFKAMGNEPGWNLTMTAADNGTFPVILVLDYGADTLVGQIQKMPIMEPDGQGGGRPTVGPNEAKYVGTLDAHGTPEVVNISIISGICTDDADKQHGTEVRITTDDQQLRGCGDYFD